MSDDTRKLIQQLLPVMLLQNASKESSGKSLKNIVIYDILNKVLPVASGVIIGFFRRKIATRSKRLYDIVTNADNITKKGSVLLERSFASTCENDDMFDAILSMASDLPQSKFIRRLPSGMFTVESDEDICLGNSVFFKRLNVDENHAVIEIFSYDKTIVELRDYLNDIEHKFRVAKSNKLGRNLYYFDELPLRPHVTPDGVDLTRQPQSLHFSMYKLHSNKTLSNVYGNAMESVRKRVRFFVDNKDWYARKGIPYTMGLLLHGDPGCGKTSLIKAIAKDTHRHIINVKLSDNTTIPQINNLFYSGTINVIKNGESSVYKIPIENTILVMEDIDCLCNVVLSRKRHERKRAAPCEIDDNLLRLVDCIIKNGVPQKPDDQHVLLNNLTRLSELRTMRNSQKRSEDKKKIVGSELKLTLSVLLNVLDGVLETPGRIIIMTSNHPERLDPALIRPGRIDSIVHFGRATSGDIRHMISDICEMPAEDFDCDDVSEKFTPAEVLQIIFENHQDGDQNTLENMQKALSQAKRVSFCTERDTYSYNDDLDNDFDDFDEAPVKDAASRNEQTRLTPVNEKYVIEHSPDLLKNYTTLKDGPDAMESSAGKLAYSPIIV